MTTWQDIATAPRDGTWVACRHYRNRPFCARWIYDGWLDENNLVRDPSVWVALPCELPEPPK